MKTNKYIKDIRKRLGLTQEQFSKMLGINRYNLAKYEAGITVPPGDIMLLIVDCATKAQKKQEKR